MQLVATAHGQTLENLMLNPSLADLIGGIQAVTLSDDEARRRGTQKTVLERKAPPTFDVVVELVDFDRLAVHHNVQKTVDLILRGVPSRPEVRVRLEGGEVEVVQREETVDIEEPGFNKRFPALVRAPQSEPKRKRQPPVAAAPIPPKPEPTGNGQKTGLIRVFPYGVARTRLERAIRERRAPVYVTTDIQQADAVIAMRSTYQTRPKKLREIAGRDVPTIVVKSNTYAQIAAALDEVLAASGVSSESESRALDEVLGAIDMAFQTGKPFDLAPQPAPVRKKQHLLAESKKVASESIGDEPQRRLRILPIRLA